MLMAGRNPEKTGRRRPKWRLFGHRAVPFILEITSRSSAEAMAAAALKEFGHIDILVNSAGMNVRKEVLSIGDADWDQVLTTNLKGVLYCCQAVGKHMVERGYGKIVTIVLDLLVPGPPRARGIRGEQGRADPAHPGHGHRVGTVHVTVNAISPSAVDTPFIDGLKKDRKKLDREIERIPMGRIANTR